MLCVFQSKASNKLVSAKGNKWNLHPITIVSFCKSWSSTTSANESNHLCTCYLSSNRFVRVQSDAHRRNIWWRALSKGVQHEYRALQYDGFSLDYFWWQGKKLIYYRDGQKENLRKISGNGVYIKHLRWTFSPLNWICKLSSKFTMLSGKMLL